MVYVLGEKNRLLATEAFWRFASLNVLSRFLGTLVSYPFLDPEVALRPQNEVRGAPPSS